MPGLKGRPQEDPDSLSSGPADFHAFLGRNLSGSYRLAVLAMGNPIKAGAIVRIATIAVWRDSAAATADELDAALRRRLEADLEAAVAADAADANGEAPDDPLDVAIRSLSPRRQIELARAFAPSGPVADASADANPAAGPDPGSDSGAALPSPIGLGLPLRALYESRDPGDSPPLQLRLQIDDDRRIAEAARAEQRSRPRGTGRTFVIRIVSAVSVLALVLALIGLAHYKASPALDGSVAPFPRVPLQISGVSLIQAGINGGPVHVGGTQTSLVAAFPPDPVWEIAARGCQSDILAVIDSNGQPTWTGAHAGHTGSVVGDPSSQGAYVAGIGTDCLPTGYFSADGGLTWSAEALPAGLTSLPSWLAFDPSSADTLLLYSAGNIYNSPNAGLTWTHSKSGVIPLDFDSSGRLVGWTKGQFYQSLDDGASWQQTGAGPVDQPPAAGATSNGTLIGTDSGLWWYPLTAGPTLVHSGRVLSIATLGDGYVVLGVDPAGHPWLGTLDASRPAFSMAPLPPEASSLQVTGGEVAVNASGAIVAFSGKSSLIALATLAH